MYDLREEYGKATKLSSLRSVRIEIRIRREDWNAQIERNHACSRDQIARKPHLEESHGSCVVWH